jgi:hypothetical protein
MNADSEEVEEKVQKKSKAKKKAQEKKEAASREPAAPRIFLYKAKNKRWIV